MSNDTANMRPAPSELAVEPFIDKREVARRIGRTVRTVDNMMRRGLLPYYKFDWQVAFRWSEVEAHLAQRCRRVGGQMKDQMLKAEG